MALNQNEIEILKLLSKGEKRPTDIANELELQLSNVSAYLRYLRDLGYIGYTTNGAVERFYFYIKGLEE